MNIIFHFGAHKTASTHLQYNLALNRKYLNENGIAYFRFQEVKGLQKKADFLAANIHTNVAELKDYAAEIKGIIEHQIKNFDKAIISYEGCLGYHNHLEHTDIYPYADKIIPVYGEILRGHSVLPLYALRDYNDYMDSTYRQELAHGVMKETINTYFANKKISPQRWTQLIEMLKDEFSGTIKIFTFEDYKTHWREICTAIMTMVTENPNPGKLLLESNKKNDSVSRAKLKFNYNLNHIFSHLPEFRYKKALYYRSIKHISPLFDNHFGDRLLKPYKKKELPVLVSHEDYNSEVKKLIKEFGLL